MADDSSSQVNVQKLDLSLDVEEVRREVSAEEAGKSSVKEVDPELDAKATQFAEMLISLDPSDVNAAQMRKTAVEDAGRELQRESSHRSMMLREPIKTLSKRGEDGGDVGNALVDLKIKVEELDPARFDFEPGWFSRMAGILPFIGTPLKRYFSQYESAETIIDAILKSLENGREQLKRDNITLAEDQKVMRVLTKKVEGQIQLLMLLDQKLQYQLDREIPQDDARHAFISDEILFPLRQRITDLQQQLAVNQQGILAIELVIRNNKELIRGVNRALDVTVGALQVAVTVALAMAHQRITLSKVTALNTTTSNLIANTAEQLKMQGVEIHKQASSAMLDMDALKHAFADINAAMDEIARFRRDALPKMAETILEMDELTKEGEKAISKMEQGNQADPVMSLDL